MSNNTAKVLGMSLEIDLPNDGSQKRDLDDLKRKIVKHAGVVEHLVQQIQIYQGQAERYGREVEDLRRVKSQAEADLLRQEELNSRKRQECYELESEISRRQAAILTQEDQIRNLAESINIAEKRSHLAIETEKAQTEEKLKAIKAEFEAEKDKISYEVKSHRYQADEEMRHFSENLADSRKKQFRTLEIEILEGKRKAEDTVAKVLADGNSKSQAIVRASEATALEVHRESESAAKRLLVEAKQKADDIIRAAHLEAEEVRRKTHNAEVTFLKEKNASLAELKLTIANANEEANLIITTANKEALSLIEKVVQENEIKISAANSKISLTRKAVEKETQEQIEKSMAELSRKIQEQEAILSRKIKETESHIAKERSKIEEDTQTILTNARDRAQIIIESANNEKNYKMEELKALELSICNTAKQAATTITASAEDIALRIVEEARLRAGNIEKTVETIVGEANAEAEKVKSEAKEYSTRIKRELPSPENWNAELAKIRQEERLKLRSMIEPTVKNYLRAIDMAISKIYVDLPAKYQSNKAIQAFTDAITNIQDRKNQINFDELIPKSGHGPGELAAASPNLRISKAG